MTAAFPTEPIRVSGGVNRVRFRADSGFTVMTARLRNAEGEVIGQAEYTVTE